MRSFCTTVYYLNTVVINGRLWRFGTYIHTYIHIYIHTHDTQKHIFMPWIVKYVTKITGCGNSQTHKHTNSQTQKHRNTQAHKYTNTQTHKHKNTQTHKHTNTQIHKHTNTQTHKHTNTQIHNYFGVKFNKRLLKCWNDNKRLKILRGTFFQCHFIYHNSDVEWSVIKSRPPRSETGGKTNFCLISGVNKGKFTR